MNICLALLCHTQVLSLGSGSLQLCFSTGGDFNSRGDIGNVWIDFPLSQGESASGL